MTFFSLVRNTFCVTWESVHKRIVSLVITVDRTAVDEQVLKGRNGGEKLYQLTIKHFRL